MTILPKARTTEIVEQDLGKELLIYDLTTNKAYSLNETSKIVFKACDSTTTFDELKRQHKFTDELIHFTLDELRAKKLIEDKVRGHFSGLSRREVIKRIGLTSAAMLPVIVEITAPAAARAASAAACNTQCSCSVANTNPTFQQFCEAQLGGTSSGCSTRLPACQCNVLPNSNVGTCATVFL